MARKRVITEREIARAVRERVASLDIGDAIVTPSARDVARQRGILLVSADDASGQGRGAAARGAGGAGGTRDDARSGGSAATGAPAREPGAPSPAREAAAPSPVRSSAVAAADRKSSPLPSAGPAARLRIAVGADHGGVAMKDGIAARLRELGHEVVDVGTSGTAPVDYPDFAVAVARRVADGKADFGVMVDGAGIGSCMAANKVPGVRAAMCYDVTTALNAREHNDARVLTLGGGLIGQRLALAIVETFIATAFGGGRHAARVAKIDSLDPRP